MQASKEVWGHLFGTIDTRQKFLDHRLELARTRMGADEGERFAGMPQLPQAPAMDLTKQTPRAARIHQRYLLTGRAHLHRLPQGHRA